MLKSLRFKHWATPPASRLWALVAAVTFSLSRASGYRILNHRKVLAWENAMGYAHTV